MHKVTDRYYGADADGNRGTPVWCYELGDSDTPEIISQIIESTGINPLDYMSSQQMLEHIKD